MKSFSRKQMELLSWWLPERGTSRYDGIICDGAVRSGKTLCMAISFFAWSMSCFNGQSFALCGKTISSVRRNLLSVVRGTLEEMGFAYSEKVSKNYVELRCGRVCNRYYLFSGKDAASASLIQGMTLAGVLFDEVALQNREFVEQAVARCSVEGSRFWFNCNPEGPGHWFYREWLQRRKQKKLYYLHFVMEDNPALSKRVRKRYELLYSGSFYRRFIQGEWVDVQGLVYPMFSLERHVVQQAPDCERFCVSCDYGTVNPCSMGLWGEQGEGGTAWQNTTMTREERERAGPMRSIMNSWKSCAEIGRSSGSLWTRVQPALLRASGGTGDIGWSRQRTGCWRAFS